VPLPRDSQTPASLEIAVAAARAAAEKQAERIVVLDVRKTIVITDYFVIASAARSKPLRKKSNMR